MKSFKPPKPAGNRTANISDFTPVEQPVEIFESSYRGKVPGLFTSKDTPPKIPDGKYQFYFTGGSKDDLLKGIVVDLDMKMDPINCRDYLLKKIQDKVDIKDKQLMIYFPFGIPFIAGTLGDIFLNKDLSPKRVIYGILTRPISDDLLNKLYPELCNISNPQRKLLVSPHCDSTDRGLSDIACLLGYLNHDGIKGDLLRRTCAAVIHFPPLITSMTQVINRSQVVGRDIVTICSTLFTFFRSYIPSLCPDNQVYEYGLRICNLIAHIPEPPEKLPIVPVQVDPVSPATKLFADLNLGPQISLWMGDSKSEFHWVSFDVQSEATIESAYKIISTFRPIAPLSMRVVSGCTIVRGKDHEFLYLMQSPSKDIKNQNLVDIIDPITGMSISCDVEEFARQQGNTDEEEAATLIDPDRVKQIIMVNFDESKSMIGDLTGSPIDPKSTKCSRVTIAIQYLTAFANRAYGYRIPCIQGLVSFNNEITLRCPLSPLVPDFEQKGLMNIHPNSYTRLWDSLLFSCKQIVEFRKGRHSDKFPNAKSRILVISDGEDVNSEAKVEDVVKELVKNQIIVDSVIISTEDECKMLCAVSHVTGGLSFRSDDIDDTISLFEKSAFLNYEERRPCLKNLLPTEKRVRARNLDPEIVTKEFMEKVSENAEFDDDIQNKEIQQATANARLATPRHVCSENAKAEIASPRQRRILRELHAAAQKCDPSSPDYDPDLKVYPFQANLDRWRVYVRAPEGTPYSGKWWYIYVTFPELYPAEPPIFRFITIPYHLNVSTEGRICLNIIEKGYISSKPVVEILQEIKELFLLPNPETPVEINIYKKFLNKDSDAYNRFARRSAKNNAKDSFEDYTKGLYIDDSVSEGFTLKFDDYVPPYMRSQISGKVIPPERRVLASTGVYYDKEELKQLISSNINPICVVTGKPLTESLEDIENDAI